MQGKVSSDRSLTSEEDARREFWKPTTGGQDDGRKTDLINNVNLDEAITEDRVKKLKVSFIIPDPSQPRKIFRKQSMEELKASIQERGVDNPVWVRQLEDGKYKLIAGERRWRSCVEIGLEEIPAIIKTADDKDAFFAAMTENIQREDLHYLDEGQAYRDAIEKGYVKNQSEIAEKLGLNRQRISDRIVIFSIPNTVKDLIYSSDNISMNHAILLSQIKDENKCIKMAHRIINEKLPVNRLRELVTTKTSTQRPKASFKAVHLRQTNNGFNFEVKFRNDRPEDIDKIIQALRDQIDELERKRNS